MRGVSAIYGSPVRLAPINKTAVGSFYGDGVKSILRGKKRAQKLRETSRSKGRAVPPDGRIPVRKAGEYNFIPSSVIVKGEPLMLLAPGWVEAFTAIVSQIRKMTGDDLHWIEDKYLCIVEDGHLPKSSCLYRLRHLIKILNWGKDDIVFVAPCARRREIVHDKENLEQRRASPCSHRLPLLTKTENGKGEGQWRCRRETI